MWCSNERRASSECSRACSQNRLSSSYDCFASTPRLRESVSTDRLYSAVAVVYASSKRCFSEQSPAIATATASAYPSYLVVSQTGRFVTVTTIGGAGEHHVSCHVAYAMTVKQ